MDSYDERQGTVQFVPGSDVRKLREIEIGSSHAERRKCRKFSTLSCEQGLSMKLQPSGCCAHSRYFCSNRNRMTLDLRMCRGQVEAIKFFYSRGFEES